MKMNKTILNAKLCVDVAVMKANFFIKVTNQFAFSTFLVHHKKQRRGKAVQMTAEKALEQNGERTLYVPTTFGAMKVKYRGQLYVYHFTRNSIARYRCDCFEKLKCPATIIIKKKFSYPVNLQHNHEPL